MLEFERTTSDVNGDTYLYYVEGDRSRCGSVLFDTSIPEFFIVHLAPGDESKSYANHLMSALFRRHADHSEMESGTVAWY